MMETRETLKPEVFHVKGNCFTFEHNGEEVVLPKLRGYKPSYKDNLVIYKEEDANGNNSTMNYSFEGKNGELKALYSVHQSGSVDVKLAGREVIHISAEDMNKIKAGEVGFFFNSAEQTDFLENNFLNRLGVNAFLTGGTGGNIFIGGAAHLILKGMELFKKKQNENPKELEMNVTSVTHEGTSPEGESEGPSIAEIVRARKCCRRA